MKWQNCLIRCWAKNDCAVIAGVAWGERPGHSNARGMMAPAQLPAPGALLHVPL